MKTIIQFAFTKVDESELPEELVVDCRCIRNPYRKGVADGVLRAEVRKSAGFLEAVFKGVALLEKSDVIYVGCAYGRHRSVAVAEEIAVRTGAVIERLT